jgi:hypothetical protein
VRDLTARDNARRIVNFDDSATIMPRPPVYEVAHSGANHEGFAGGGHDVPVGTRWIDIWGTEWHKSHAGVMGFPKGHPLIDMGRTPNQTILVDYVGLANFALHLFDMQAEMAALYEALLTRFRRLIEIVAEGPGRYVCVLENFTSET